MIVEDILYNIKQKLSNAVEKTLLSDRPIGCLLSGGLDSSVITSLVCKFMDPSKVKHSQLVWKIPDLIASKKVSEYLGIHTSVTLTEEECLME